MWDRIDTAQLKLCLGILGYVVIAYLIGKILG